jgi:molybdopterin molybdotransferase
MSVGLFLVFVLEEAMTELFTLMSIDKAWDLFRTNIDVPKNRKEEVHVLNSLGRILAEDVVSGEDMPGFGRSTMDGFAVRAKDTFGATDAMPAMLVLAGEVLMGCEAVTELKPGQVIRIATGGMLPQNADAVVMVEYTEQMDSSNILVNRPVAPGENVVRRGEDISVGEVLVMAGRPVRPQEIGAMAGLGIISCSVVQKPVVGIVSSGDEIVDPGDIPSPGQVRDINSFALAGLVQEAGGKAIQYGIIKDEFVEMESGLKKALNESDIVVVSGGSSVGTRDVTSAVFNSLGKPGVLVHGVSIKPGKPTVLGVINNKPVLGLPGHPASAMILAEIFLVPLIRAFLGLGFTSAKKHKTKALMGRSMASASGRVDYIRVAITERDGTQIAEPVLGKSGLITTMVKADGIVIIPMAKEGIEAGEAVEVILF